MGQVRHGEADERGVQRRAALAAMYAAACLLQLRCAEGHAVARVIPSGTLVVLDVHVLGGAMAVPVSVMSAVQRIISNL